MKKQLFMPLMAFFLFAIEMKSNAQWNLTGNSNATTTSILGTTNAVNLNLTTRNLTRLVIDSNGKVGIGIAAPQNVFSVKGSGGTPAAVWVSAGGPLFTGFGEQTVGNADYILSMASTLSNARPVFIGRRSKGTLAAPLSMANNDFIMSFLSSAYDGAAFQNPAAIDFFVDGIPAAGSIPARISFVTGSNSSNRAERLKIGNTGDITINTNQFFVQKTTGNVGIGTISPQAKMDITGNIKIADGTQGTGKVLTSDATGLATWQSIPATAETDPQVSSSGTNKVPRWNGTTLTDGSITDNGNVGIGESNPQGKFHVSEPFTFNGATFSGTGLNDLTANISGYSGIGSTVYVIRIQNSGPIPNFIEISNDGGATFSSPIAITNPVVLANGVTATFGATGGHTFGDQWTWTAGPSFADVLVVKNGKTGIGTASPDATLHVAGNVKIADGTQATGKVLNSDADGLSSWQAIPTQVENDPKVGTLAIGFIPEWNGTTLVNSTIMDSSGFIGIGTNAPRKLLDVNGDARINGMTIGRGNDSSSTIIGRDALDSNTTGKSNIAIGLRALNKNKKGSSNIAIGIEALNRDTTGSANIAIGNAALHENKNRTGLVAIGDSASFAASGTSNTAVGNRALRTNSGSSNTAVGDRSMYANITGGSNTAVGSFSLSSNINGYENIALGGYALGNNTTGVDNTALGFAALNSYTIGNQNTATGSYALSGNGSSSYGSNNTATGYGALNTNTTGYSNTAIGSLAMVSNFAGNNNTAVGDSALYSTSSGSANTAVGKRALSKTTSSGSTAIGADALKESTSAFDNTAVGRFSMNANITGSFNVALGNITMQTNSTGSLNTAIGYNANVNSGALSNASAIGAGSLVSASNSMQLGSTSVTSIKGGNNVTIVSDARFKRDIQENVPGLSFIQQLRPVTYTFDIHKLNQYIAPESAAKPGEIEEAAIKAKEQIHYTGLLAQEVEKAAENINYDFSGLYKPQNSKDPYGLSYAEFVVPLVKAVQELSKKNEELGITNDELKKAKTEQDNRIAKLEAMMQQLLNSKATAPCPPLAGQ